MLFSRSSRTHRNHSTAQIAVRPSFSTIRCKTLNIFIKVCYSPTVIVAMLDLSRSCREDSDPVGTPRRLFDSFSNARTPGHSSHFGTHLTPFISLSFQPLPGVHFATPFFSNSCRNGEGCTPLCDVQAFRGSDAPFASPTVLRDVRTTSESIPCIFFTLQPYLHNERHPTPLQSIHYALFSSRRRG